SQLGLRTTQDQQNSRLTLSRKVLSKRPLIRNPLSKSKQITRFKMDEINATILKTTIEEIPGLTEENYLSWCTRISVLFKLGGVKDQSTNGKPALEESNNTILCAIIIAKLLATTHNNVFNSANEDDAIKLWKAISNNISFEASKLEKFITEVQASLLKMQDVGICMDNDIITYDLLRRLPESLDNIK
ncbi:hypothetical protein VP01_1578g1, partial [Puccinia sorghi]